MIINLGANKSGVCDYYKACNNCPLNELVIKIDLDSAISGKTFCSNIPAHAKTLTIEEMEGWIGKKQTKKFLKAYINLKLIGAVT